LHPTYPAPLHVAVYKGGRSLLGRR
jgi:hypothetical protein